MENIKILVIDDEKLICEMIKTELEKQQFSVTCVTEPQLAVKEIERNDYDAILLDLMLPHISGLEMLQMILEKKPHAAVIMITANASVEMAVKAIKLGAFHYVTKPFSMEELALLVKRAVEFKQNNREVNYYKKELKKKFSVDVILGKSKEILTIKAMIRKVALSDVKIVLIEGESGVGKELVARAIHSEGARAKRPFVAVNCASLPENLLESELFGHEKGAFTDAKTAKEGLIEFADGGTLFLDEIGDMPLSIQAKLLRFLEDRTVRRVGGLQDIAVDVQVSLATNKNLKKLVMEGKFREDLFYRIQVIPIYVPALRERRDDIQAIAESFIGAFNREFKKNIQGLSPMALKMVINYKWPGNIRELKNVIERAMIFEDTDMILIERLPPEIISAASRTPQFSVDFKIPESGVDIEEIECELVRQALTMARGNQSKAARLLNIGVDAMRYRMKKFGYLK